MTTLLSLDIRSEQDLVAARQRARQVAALFGLEAQDQARLATAVSEVARNAFQHAGGGTVEFRAEAGSPPLLRVLVQDNGPGLPDPPPATGLGLVGARRLVDEFRAEPRPGGGTAVLLGKRAPALTAERLARAAAELARRPTPSPLEEVRQQNRELLRTLEELQERQAELARLNGELDETNRGVLALYAELDERADALRRASDTKSRFLSNMSHEFRTPLNSIRSLAQILLDRTDGELTAEQERQVRYIRKAAEDLSELVNDLLDLAKVEAGKLPVRPAEFEAADLFGALRGMLRPLLGPGPEVALVFEEPAGLAPLHTDENKVAQVLRNFISNALKFTERGEVRVSAAAGADDAVVFAVADTGIGIAAEDQERIFQEFAQLDVPRQRRVKGTGLGLPLSRRLAGLLGGSVAVHSRPGQGSTFTLTIPRVYRGPAEAAAGPGPEESPRPDPARRPVLVAEDNPETLFVYEKFLQGSGFQAVPARNLAAARRALGQFRPAAVVLDILLGEGESGWDLLADLKANEATRAIPVVVATVVDNPGKAAALGAEAFTTKPVERAWLLDRLNALAGPGGAAPVLVIDDDEVSRYLLRGLLAEVPVALAEAADGREGLLRARCDRPRAIFLDLDLPDQSGREVLQALRSDPLTCDIPVIIHTSQVLPEGERARLASKVTAVLSKLSPSREAALAQVREALAQAGGLDPSAPPGPDWARPSLE